MSIASKKRTVRLMRHSEKHFASSALIRDVVIGMADGLTVPFALAAGLAGAVASTHLVVIGGVAEIAAGAVAMGLGGYLAARTDRDHYQSELAREAYEVEHMPELERDEVAKIFADYGLPEAQLGSVVTAITADKQRWVELMMKHELGLEKPDPQRAPVSALTIGVSYIVGGFVPLISYIMLNDPHRALLLSVLLTGLALTIFGAIKAYLTSMPVVRGAVETLLVGGAAAGVAFAVARAVS